MARILDEASVRITADTRAGEADAAAAGRRFGKAFAAGADEGAGSSDVSDKLAKDVESASARVTKARDAEANASGRVRVAEASLNDIRDKGNATAGRLAAAEERLASAKRAQVAASTTLEAAEAKLSSARAAATTLSDKFSASMKTLTTNTGTNTSVIARLRAAIVGLGGDGETVGKKIDAAFKAINLTGLLTNLLKIGGALTVAGVGALAAHAAIGGLIEAIVGLIGSISQLSGLAVALPAIIGAAGLALATLKVGFSGFGQALKDAGDPAKFAKDLQDLAPAAQAAAIAFQQMQPALHNLKFDVQQRLFDGLSTSIQQLGKNYLPILRTNMDKVASSFNSAFKFIGQFLNNASTVKELSGAFGNLQKGVSSATGALLPLTQAFTDIFAVGSTLVPKLGTEIAALAAKFAGFIEDTRASGQLAAFLRNGITAAKEFGQVFVNIGSTLAEVFHAAQSATGGFLKSLVSITTEMRNVVNSVAGQQALTAFFAGTQAAIKALLPVVGGVIQVIGALGPALQSIGTVAAPIIGQLINSLVAGIKNAIPGVTAFADAFIRAVGTLGPLLPLLGSVASGIGFALAGALNAVTPLLSALVDVLKFFGPVLGPIAVILGTVAVSLAGLGVVIKTVTTLFGLLKPAIALLTGNLKVLGTEQKAAALSADALAVSEATVGKTATASGVAVEAAGGKMSSSWKTAGVAAGAYVAGLGLLAVGQENTGTGFKDMARDAADTAGKLLTLDFGGVVDKIGRDVQRLPTDVERVKTRWGPAWDAITGVVTDGNKSIGAAVAQVADTVRNALTPLPQTVNGVLGGLVPVINTGVHAIAAAVGQLPPLTQASLVQLGPAMRPPVQAAMGGLLTVVTSGIVNINNQVLGLTPQVQAALVPLSPTMQQAVSSALGGTLPIVSAGVANITAAMAQIPPQASGSLASLPRALSGPVTAAMGGLGPIVTSGVQNITNQIAQLPPQAQANLGGLGGAVSGPMSDAMNILNGATRDGITNATNQLRQLPPQSSSAVGNMSGTLQPAGTSAMSGFYNSMASFYNNTIAPWLSSLANKIAILKGPLDKDRKLLIPHGAAIMAGLDEGLRDGFGPVTKTAGLVAGTIADAVAKGQKSLGSVDLGSFLQRSLVSQVTANAVGSGAGGPNFADISAAFAQAINSAQLVAKGADLTMVVNRGNLNLARRS